MDAFWIIKSSFPLFGTKLAKNQPENYPTLTYETIVYLKNFLTYLPYTHNMYEPWKLKKSQETVFWVIPELC